MKGSENNLLPNQVNDLLMINNRYKTFARFLSCSCALFLGLITGMTSGMASERSELASRLQSPFGQIQDTRSFDVRDHLIVASQVKWVNNALRMDNSVRVEVQGESQLQWISEGHDSQQVYQALQQEIEGAGGQVVFSCESRDCGESNVWANRIFGQSKLYGKDREQFYSVSALTLDDAPYMVVLYTIKRGNGRVYAYTEMMKLAQVPTKFDRFFAKKTKSSDLVMTVAFDRSKELDILTDSLHRQIDAKLSRFPNHELWILCRLEAEGVTAPQAMAECTDIVETTRRWLLAKGIAPASIKMLPLGVFPRTYQAGSSQLIIEFAATE